MLDRITRWSRQLFFLRHLFLLLLIIAGGVFVTELFIDIDGYPKDYWLIPSATILLWSGSLWLMAVGFGTTPGPAEHSQGFWRRQKQRLKRLYFALLSLMLLAMFCGAMLSTLRFVRVWTEKY